MVRPLCRAASWWRRLGTLLLLVGIVLSPLRAMAATIPVLTAYEVAVRSTATTVLGKHDAVRPETERARTACADATLAYDEFSNWPTAAGLRGVLAYDGAVELTERRELTEGAIYDATAPTTAAEGLEGGGMAAIRQLGTDGEDAANILKNTEHIPSASGTAAYRIPDVLDHGAQVIGDVKNVGRLSYTSQLRDYASYAQQNGYQFQLWVRPTTQLSGPLAAQVANGNIILNFLP